jgi:uncharacterized iron-regulated membrane protein
MRSVRTVLFWLHLSAGVCAGIVVLVLSLTGFLLAFERQINAWVDAPAVLQGPTDAAPHLQIESVIADLRDGGQGVPTELALRNAPNAAIEARYGRERTLLLNPWTAEVVGQPSESSRAFFGIVERVHRSLGLGMRSALGRGITGAANLVFLSLLVSGAFLWLPKSLSVASLKSRVLFRGGLKGKAREWNWHHTLGVWSLIPLFCVVLTGVVISYPWASNLLYTVTGTQPPAGGWRGEGGPQRNGSNRAASSAGAQAATAQGLNQALLTAELQIPAWKMITVSLPKPEDKVMTLNVDKSVGGQPEQATQLVIDRQSGSVKSVKRFSDNNAGRKLRAWARFLHTGEELGWVGQTIAALACLSAILLVWTGLSLAVRRAAGALSGYRQSLTTPEDSDARERLA